MQPLRVLLVQLGSNGDCLFVTTIAKQIKEIDYPGCHLTWMIGSCYKQVINNNPFIDEIIEIPVNGKDDLQKHRDLIHEHIENAGGSNFFQKIFITDYTKSNFHQWFGSTRSSLFRNYPHQINIDPKPIMLLTEQEKENVAKFCKEYKIYREQFNILFECAPQSGQSSMSLEKALDIAEEFVSENKNVKFILSSNKEFKTNNANIIDGSKISWRENAELLNYCNLLVGCSSGISWLCTSSWCKELPFIQVVNPNYMNGRISASMKNDFRYFGISTKKLLEINDAHKNKLKACIRETINGNFVAAKKKYDITDDSWFLNRELLKESKLPVVIKVLGFSRQYITKISLSVYRKGKSFLLKIIK